MTNLTTLAAAAAKAQTALAAAQAEQAAIEKAAADDRQARSVAWALTRAVAYPGDLGAAEAAVGAALAQFDGAVLDDWATTPAAYLRVIEAMAAVNRIGADLTRARGILKLANELPAIDRQGRDPVGASAPYALTHGSPRVAGFLELAAETLDKARQRAAMAPSPEQPEEFQGQVSPALKRAALSAEWLLAQEFELLLGLREQHPQAASHRLNPRETGAASSAG